MFERKVPLPLNKDEVLLYLNSVKKAFHDEPVKYDEFINVSNDLTTHRVDVASIIARVEKLLKNHLDLLSGFNLFLPDDAKITIPTVAAKHYKSYYTKKNHTNAENFINKLKTRFWRLDSHVVGSFQKIMKMFKEGKMSEKEAYNEVIDILYYHEDLINDFSRFFAKSGHVATSSLLLQI